MQGRIASLNVSQATAVFLSRLSESATALHR
jgi:tRNA G18 (ribose-2'-O)-methylase SpoU